MARHIGHELFFLALPACFRSFWLVQGKRIGELAFVNMPGFVSRTTSPSSLRTKDPPITTGAVLRKEGGFINHLASIEFAQNAGWVLSRREDGAWVGAQSLHLARCGERFEAEGFG